MIDDLRAAAEELAAAMNNEDRRVVFAESCTGGLASAKLVEVPGVSEHHCGSAVVYRFDTKCGWLGVERSALEDPGPVSGIVAEQMARGVLELTPEADVAVSITGELGPNAPTLDGTVVIGWCTRDGVCGSVTLGLRSRERADRQREAAALVLRKGAEMVLAK